MDTMILEIKGIKGNSLIDGHADKIQILGFSHAVFLRIGEDAANSERTLGRPTFTDFSFNKLTDQSTPALYGACAGGKKIGDAKFMIGRNENDKFMPHMVYTLRNAMVATISTNNNSSGDLVDSFTLHFTGFESEYTQQNIDSTKKGTAAFGWDVAKNKTVSPSAGG